MTDREFEEIKRLFQELYNVLSKYGKGQYNIQLNIIKRILECIDSEIDEKAKENYILRNYNNLYPAKGGLSDFYIQDEEFGERLKLNAPLDRINDTLWRIIKKYL